MDDVMVTTELLASLASHSPSLCIRDMYERWQQLRGSGKP